jgi:hypothetical protein
LPQGLAVVACWKADYRFTRRHVIYDAGFSANFHTVSNYYMIFNRALTPHHNAVAQGYGPGQTALAGHYNGSTEPAIVSDMHEIIELGTVTDRRCTELTPVDAAACPDLNAVADRNRADVRYLHEAPSVG